YRSQTEMATPVFWVTSGGRIISCHALAHGQRHNVERGIKAPNPGGPCRTIHRHQHRVATGTLTKAPTNDTLALPFIRPPSSSPASNSPCRPPARRAHSLAAAFALDGKAGGVAA